jgi:hypothetical protein
MPTTPAPSYEAAEPDGYPCAQTKAIAAALGVSLDPPPPPAMIVPLAPRGGDDA